MKLLKTHNSLKDFLIDTYDTLELMEIYYTRSYYFNVRGLDGDKKLLRLYDIYENDIFHILHDNGFSPLTVSQVDNIAEYKKELLEIAIKLCIESQYDVVDKPFYQVTTLTEYFDNPFLEEERKTHTIDEIYSFFKEECLDICFKNELIYFKTYTFDEFKHQRS